MTNKRLCSIAKNALVDKQVFLAYPTGRKIGERRLVIGDNAQIRCGTTIYEGTTIGSYLTTGHNVVIREENLIGERVLVGSGAVVTKDIPPCSVVTGNPAKVICAIDELKCSRGLTDHPYR